MVRLPYYRDESADAAVTKLFAAVGVQVLGSETIPRRICGRCCWGAGAGERDGGNESADGAVTMLFEAVGAQLLLPCYLQLLGCSCWGAIRRRRICGRCCYHAICSCWGAGAGERD